MKHFAALLIVAVVSLAAAQEFPGLPCTFSTKYVESYHEKNPSSLSRAKAYLYSNIASRRLVAQEALNMIANGASDADLPVLNDYSIDAMWYMIHGEAGAQLYKNQTHIWVAPNITSFVYPFFDRFVCFKIALDGTEMHCPEIVVDAKPVFSRYGPCQNNPGKECAIWAAKYVYDQGTIVQEIYFIKNTNVLDLMTVEDSDMYVREDFIGMDLNRPDSSHFIVPKDQPCTDTTLPPTANSKRTWTRNTYTNSKKFRKTSLGMMLNMQRPRKQWGQIYDRLSKPHRAIPTFFDARDKWNKCDSIKSIRNQKRCGSCWAFGAAESFSDRYCIAGGNTSSVFSPQYLVDCCTGNNGCSGGDLDIAWYALVDQGLPLDKCKPYAAEEHKCTQICDDTHKKAEFVRAKNAYSVYVPFNYEETVRGIQEEIMENGPVEAGFLVFTDFDSYSSGVYQRTAEAFYEGGHAVKIIGWGVDKDTNVPYWLIANSWGEEWGENGFFRMRRGTNECGIETEIAAGLVDI